MFLCRNELGCAQIDKEDATVLATRLKRARQDAGLTKEGAAKLVGISKASIDAYEQGRNMPPADRLRKLADIYGVSTDYLLGRVDQPDLSTGRMAVADLPAIERFMHAHSLEEVRPLLNLEPQPFNYVSFFSEPASLLAERDARDLLLRIEYHGIEIAPDALKQWRVGVAMLFDSFYPPACTPALAALRF